MAEDNEELRKQLGTDKPVIKGTISTPDTRKPPFDPAARKPKSEETPEELSRRGINLPPEHRFDG